MASGKFVGLIHFNFPVLFGLISICFRRANYFTRVSWERRDNKTGSGEFEVSESLETSLTTHDFAPAASLKRKTYREEESVTNCQILRHFDVKMGECVGPFLLLSGELCCFIFINLL